jgi:hypothetical protein
LIQIGKKNEMMEEKKLLDGELEEVSGGTWHETEQFIEMIKYAGYEDFGNKLYAMDYVERDLAVRKFLNTHGCGPYGYSLYQGRENRYSIGGKFISHEEFMKGVGKKLGLKESQVSYFL